MPEDPQDQLDLPEPAVLDNDAALEEALPEEGTPRIAIVARLNKALPGEGIVHLHRAGSRVGFTGPLQVGGPRGEVFTEGWFDGL